MKEVKCYCCKKLGHYAIDNYFNQEANGSDKEEAKFTHAKNSDFEKSNLLILINLDKSYDKSYDKSMRISIRFADNIIVTNEYIRNILLNKKDGQEVIIGDVLYILSMASNLISFEMKKYTMRL